MCIRDRNPTTEPIDEPTKIGSDTVTEDIKTTDQQSQ